MSTDSTRSLHFLSEAFWPSEESAIATPLTPCTFFARPKGLAQPCRSLDLPELPAFGCTHLKFFCSPFVPEHFLEPRTPRTPRTVQTQNLTASEFATKIITWTFAGGFIFFTKKCKLVAMVQDFPHCYTPYRREHACTHPENS